MIKLEANWIQIGRLNWQLIEKDNFTAAKCLHEGLNYGRETRKED